MPRVRSIRPTFWSDEKIGLVPREARLTFLGLISAMADDDGRLSGNPRIVRGAVFPYDDDITSAEVEGHLRALDDVGVIRRYEVNGQQFIQIPNWLRHQKIDRPSPSLLPGPPDDQSSDVRRPIVEDSTNDRRSFAQERRGEEGSGVDTPSSPSSAPARDDREAIRAIYPRVADALPPLPDGTDVLLQLLGRVPDSRAYLGEMLAALEGMHGVMLTAEELRTAVTDWVANSERPNLRRFRGYLRGAKPRPGSEVPREKPQELVEKVARARHVQQRWQWNGQHTDQQELTPEEDLKAQRKRVAPLVQDRRDNAGTYSNRTDGWEWWEAMKQQATKAGKDVWLYAAAVLEREKAAAVGPAG